MKGMEGSCWQFEALAALFLIQLSRCFVVVVFGLF